MMTPATLSFAVCIGAPQVGFPEFLRLAKLAANFDTKLTIFAKGEDVVLHEAETKQLAGMGHEFGCGALLGSTIDGRLTTWTLDAVKGELAEYDDAMVRMGLPQPKTGLLPGRYHVAAGGSYRNLLYSRYSVVIAGSAMACRWKSQPGIPLLSRAKVDSVAAMCDWGRIAQPRVILFDSLSGEFADLFELALHNSHSLEGAFNVRPLSEIALPEFR